jgi:MFS transporter, DHA3 family, macrolide efflux protein
MTSGPPRSSPMNKLLALATRSGPAYLVRARGFRLLWLGETVSQIGDGLNRVALLWFVYQTHHSTLKTSVVGVLQTLPALILSPLIGVYLDRWPKKRMLILVSVAHGALVALMPILFALGVLHLGLLYGLVLLTSVVATFYGPTLTLAVPLIVDPEDLRAANALIQSTATIGVLLGPLVAGVAISVFGTANVLYLDAATFMFFVACMAFVPVHERPRPQRAPLVRSRLARELREGLRFMIRKQTGILLLTLVASLQNFGASAFIFLLPTLAKAHFSALSLSVGALWSAFGGGMLLAALVIASIRNDPRRGLTRLVPAALACGGAAVMALTHVHSRFGAGALMVVTGFAAASLGPVVITLLEEGTPERLRGRVITTFNTANMAMAMLGMLAFGWAADHVGETPALVAVGLVLFSSAVVLFFVSRTGRASRLIERAQTEAHKG